MVATRTALIAPPPLLLSLASTPVADTFSGVLAVTVYASSTAVGGVRAVTVNVTVAMFPTPLALEAR